MKLKVLVTGGTIDGLEYESEEEAPTATKTLIPGLLKEARITAQFSIDALISKDSKFLTDGDRRKILKSCHDCEEKNIVITHGTITMAKTAKYLDGKITDKTVVLTGSMVPANQEKSDALFNLGSAFIAAQTLPAGVYVAMNGKIFKANNVTKNMERGLFEEET